MNSCRQRVDGTNKSRIRRVGHRRRHRAAIATQAGEVQARAGSVELSGGAFLRASAGPGRVAGTAAGSRASSSSVRAFQSIGARRRSCFRSGPLDEPRRNSVEGPRNGRTGGASWYIACLGLPRWLTDIRFLFPDTLVSRPCRIPMYRKDTKRKRYKCCRFYMLCDTDKTMTTK